MNKIIGPLILSFFCLKTPIVLAQPTPPPYTGGLGYALPLLRTVPPVTLGMPSDIASAYAYFDLAMRLSPTGSTYKFLDSLHYGDTLKFLADYYYRVGNYNPVLFASWQGASYKALKPYPYKTGPGGAASELLNHIAQVFPDTDRTWMLVRTPIIAHIHVYDTVMYNDPDRVYPDWGVVRASIIDEIKGQFIPGCPIDIYKSGKGNAKPTSIDIPMSFADSVGLGTGTIASKCIQFNYSLEWSRRPRRQGRDYADDNFDYPLFDSTNGSWIKPGRDYIVFLSFLGLDADSVKQYFTIWPVLGFGWSAGMYQITSISGSPVVSDPNDDFGIGASSGLSPTEWKTRLRAKIYKITNP